MDKPTAPKGYTLVRDESLGSYTPPPGYRLVPAVKRRRMKEGLDGRRQANGGVEYRKLLDGFVARMRAVEAAGVEGVGKFVRYGRTTQAPSLLRELYEEDRRWAFIPSQGGYLRLAEEEKPFTARLLDYKPGEFIGCTSRGRTPGFASVRHPGFDTPRVRVRLPDPDEMEAGVGMEYVPGVKPPAGEVGPGVWAASKEREDLIGRIHEVCKGNPEVDVGAIVTWAGGAPLGEVREWVTEAEGGVK